MLKCIHCDKEFKYESERKRHQESHFPQFECRVCAKKFSFLSALRRHQKQHERKGSVRCYECGGSFRDDILLKRHIQYAHTGTYNCSECSSTFSSKQALRTHSNIHKPESERRFRCTFEGCEKAFNFPHHLKHHELTHTNDKQFFCNVCGKGFIQSHHLKTHLKNHHPENWLFCSVPSCKKKFVTEHAFNKHMITHSDNLDDNCTELRFDSGISSDSNSANDTREKGDIGDNVLCASCGKLILAVQYLNHTFKCAASKEDFRDDDLNSVLGNYESIAAPQDSNNGTYQITLDTYAVDAEVEVNENRVSGFTEMFSYGNTELENTVARENEGISGTDNVIVSSDACVGCACGNVQSAPCSRNSDNDSSSKLEAVKTHDNNSMPEIEYTKDGIVKIKETFDTDIVVTIKVAPTQTHSDVKIESKYVPFNSCKAVLGNCIVSEDGSVGEGCLCARMIVDEQQMSAQEIDELTPHPHVL